VKVDGILATHTGAAGFIQHDDTDEVTAAGLLGNAKPGRQWRAQDGWTPVEVTFTPEEVDAVNDIPDTFGRLFAIAEILATRGTRLTTRVETP
jgi:hypothetical protein